MDAEGFTVGLVGFGSSIDNISSSGGTINITSTGAGETLNFAFSVPRDGIITSITAYFSTAIDLSFPDSTITVTAQLYRSSPPPNNVFTPIPAALVTLMPDLTGAVSLGTILENALNLVVPEPVTQRTRLLMVFFAQITAGDVVTTSVVGYASAGVTIS
ncbi:exosporium glycoprotein BclB-related protein [Sporomusa aerivorans]|uniref:exosporium glycoprotein BclB-related protein n=1 Tax=Sporomusa aerivorans TaxID=204936 RepID=UPI00352AAE86